MESKDGRKDAEAAEGEPEGKNCDKLLLKVQIKS